MTSVHPKKTLRLSARIDAKIARKIAQLSKRKNKTASEIICESIEQMYARDQAEDALAIMTSAGFVGSFEGPRDLSESYKDSLTDTISAKHGVDRR